jgi:hypothetical protein
MQSTTKETFEKKKPLQPWRRNGQIGLIIWNGEIAIMMTLIFVFYHEMCVKASKHVLGYK